MHCHLCAQGAVGMCRQCYKFYCEQHGEGFCDSCQQKGWSLQAPMMPTATVASVATATATKEAPKVVASVSKADGVVAYIKEGAEDKPKEAEAEADKEKEKEAAIAAAGST